MNQEPNAEKLMLDIDAHFMGRALEMAHQAVIADEVPVGAIIVRNSTIIAAAANQRESLKDPTAHAEMIAITQAAAAVEDWRLEQTTLYVTLEPCIMCAGAILQSRIPRVVFGASDPKAGAVTSLYQLLDDSRLNHRCNITTGVMADRCGQVLTDFFASKRAMGKK
ncbi:tRNA-specific adenosine deaminase [Planctomycetes bacterium CA13]|uniref:tRNA-specific adenosine deaminase n=1 Tax=Novipirellula herctigrandis TaxID=2527986 RepID=A0A5C5ZAD1_9BACT|nr:tRNA-specific adenosine deaminase [Planctomycetes bacterium CA13]